jgi:quinol monooxygenase YgiN
MIKTALMVRLQAKKGKESEVEKFLLDALPLVENEPATSTWYALRLGPSTYGIFDTFPDDEGRQAHLSGKVANALKERSPELFSEPPVIEKPDVLAVKMPEVIQY